MESATRDGEVWIYADGFGITSVSKGKTAKSEAAMGAGGYGRLTLNGEGTAFALNVHSATGGVLNVVLDSATLKAKERLERASEACFLLDDGGWNAYDSLRFGPKSYDKIDLTELSAKDIPPLSWHEWKTENYFAVQAGGGSFWKGAGDVFACWQDEVAYFGRVAPEISLFWKMPLVVKPGSVLTLYPTLEYCDIVVFQPAASCAELVRVSAEGKILLRRESTALGVPSVWGDHWSFQPEETRIVRESLTDGRQESVDLPELLARVRSKASPKRSKELEGLDGVGVGEVVLNAAGWAFVPWHHESVIFVDTAVEVPRKLPSIEFAGRQAVTKGLRDARVVLAKANIHAVCRAMVRHPKTGHWKLELWTTGGDRGLIASILHPSNEAHVFDLKDLSVISLCLGFAYAAYLPLETNSKSELEKALAELEEIGDPRFLAAFVVERYNQWHIRDSEGKSTFVAPLDNEAEDLAVRTLLEWMAGKKATGSASGAPMLGKVAELPFKPERLNDPSKTALALFHLLGRRHGANLVGLLERLAQRFPNTPDRINELLAYAIDDAKRRLDHLSPAGVSA